LPRDPETWPTVDVFIPTYNEPLEIVRPTVMAALNIDWPRDKLNIYILDDGRRDEFRAFAELCGCGYIIRPDNKGAKAGNLNHGLRHATGEFVAVIDADHCAQPNFLDRLLGYFRDPEVSFVQSPQDYYNLGSFQHGFGRSSSSTWHEQSAFNHLLQPARDTHNATTLCGCSCVLRRAHLDLIGGIPEDTVTEDMHAAVRLQKLGLKSVYHDEPLAFGLAPPDFRGFLRQRLRWGEGNLQVCRIEGLPLNRRLTWQQNICYVMLTSAYVDAWRKLILFVSPPLSLLFEVPPVCGDPLVFALLFSPYVLISWLTYSEFFAGFARINLTETYDMARLSAGLTACWGLFRRNIRFRVTSKRLLGRSPAVMLLPQLLIAGLCLAAAIVAPLRWLAIWQGVRGAWTPVWIEAVLLVLSLFYLQLAVKVMLLAKRSAAIEEDNFVFDIELPLRLLGHPYPGPWLWTRQVSLDMVSLDMAALCSPAPAVTARRLAIELLLPDGPLIVDAEWRDDKGAGPCLHFLWNDARVRDRLDQALHAGRWHRVLAGRTESGLTLFERLGWLTPPATRLPEASAPWQPVVLHRSATGFALGYVRARPAEPPAEVISFGDDGSWTEIEIVARRGRTTGQWLRATGGVTRPMLDEGALETLDARRRAVLPIAGPSDLFDDRRVRGKRTPATFAAGE
ncbi:MAG: glycosyltransferase, partial [Alphaproteobacteria bacterium]|nr:glycosyltransferase [Alphaproteobacteria bacterium]